MNVIEKQNGAAFLIKKGQLLKVTDISGAQVSDLVFFNAADYKEKFSAGKTMDFEECILMVKGNSLWSNRGRKLMTILEDTNGRNDLLLAPCSQQTFEIMYGIKDEHPSCLNNLAVNLKSYGVSVDDIPTAFNVFMNVQFDELGFLEVKKPTSKAGDFIILEAHDDLLIGMTACSAPDSNGGSFKQIGYEILEK